MIKPLAGGARAMAVFNLDAAHAADFTLEADWLGTAAPSTVTDAWRQKSVPRLRGGDTVQLSPNGVALFVVQP